MIAYILGGLSGSACDGFPATSGTTGTTLDITNHIILLLILLMRSSNTNIAIEKVW